MKTQEELNALKKEVETLNRKLAELTEEELAQVIGGTGTNTSNVCEMTDSSGLPLKDPNTAKEMVKYTTELTLKQATQAMMAHINQNLPLPEDPEKN